MRRTAVQLGIAASMVALLIGTGCGPEPTQSELPDAGPLPISTFRPQDAGSELGDGGVEPVDGGVVPVDGGVDPVDGGVVPVDGGVDPVDGGVQPDAGTLPVPLVPVVGLRADTNRDGVVSLGDDDALGRDSWTSQRGAIFLANIDDDTKRCPFSSTISDIDLAKCHDASDEVVNGDDDLLDLAYLKTVPWPQAPQASWSRLRVSAAAKPFVRLFRNDGAGWKLYPPDAEIFAADLRAGANFAIEGKDIVRDPQVWDGMVDLTWEVNYLEPVDNLWKTFTDVVRMRISPVMTFHHLLPAQTVFVSAVGGSADSTAFQSAMTTAIAGQVPNPLYKYAAQDQWIQDFFETGYMSMPKAGGGQHVIRVNIRSANVYSTSATNPLRPAGRIVYQLRGKDQAAIQQFDKTHDQNMDTLNSFGNTETIPPYTHNGVSFPLGRMMRGRTSGFYPAPSVSRMFEAQKIQPPLYLDTSWLLVGHVDETISFLKTTSPRGWIVLANDPALARQMLQAEVAKGNGAVKMFVGKKWIDWNSWNQKEIPADVTISQVLANTEVMNESAIAVAEVDTQLALLKAQTGVTDQEIIRVPFLHEPADGYSVAYQPGTVNLLVLNDTTVVVPLPHGPVINGKDIFKDHLETALAPYGYTVKWVENWNLYHRLSGEVHCGTNTARQIPAATWWESGR